MIIDIIALLEVIKLGAETIEAALEVIEAIQEAIDAITLAAEPTYADMPPEIKTEVLKRVTKIVVNLDLNLSCYPLGYTTTLLFDAEGNPIP